MATFTKEQQTAIEVTGKAIVSASAGSGKTTVMIEKIIRLILQGAKVSEILAVTFTKKAASQMKDKLKRELIKAVNADTTTPEDRKRLKDQLSEVASADISTIHSFCAKLIRSHFFDAGVAGDFKIISSDDADGVALKNLALDKVLEEAFNEDIYFSAAVANEDGNTASINANQQPCILCFLSQTQWLITNKGKLAGLCTGCHEILLELGT